MTRKPVRTSSDVEPPNVDDLKAINGIGSGVESRLHRVGIYTFTQLATLSPADIAASVSDLTNVTAERIIKQDWIGQARRLASLSASMTRHFNDATHESASIEPQTNVQIDGSIQAATPQTASETSHVIEEAITPIHASIHAPIHTPAQASLFIDDMDVVLSGGSKTRMLLPCHRPFTVHLSLSPVHMLLSDDAPYTIAVSSRHIEDRSQQTLSKVHGILHPANNTPVAIECAGLQPGTYRLEATVAISATTDTTPSSSSDVSAHIGFLLYCY